MDPTMPLSLTPTTPPSPQPANSALNNMIQALQGGGSAYANSMSPGSVPQPAAPQATTGGTTPAATLAPAGSAPNYNQFGNQATTALLTALMGSPNAGGSSGGAPGNIGGTGGGLGGLY